MSPIDLVQALPHKPPMRLVDEIVDVRGGESAIGRRRTAASDFFFQGHFPGQPIVPAVMLVELLAQVGGVAVAVPGTGDAAPPTLQLRVAAINGFKFPAPAAAGVLLEAHARVTGRIGSLYKIEGTVTADGVVVASGSVTLAGGGN